MRLLALLFTAIGGFIAVYFTTTGIAMAMAHARFAELMLGAFPVVFWGCVVSLPSFLGAWLTIRRRLSAWGSAMLVAAVVLTTGMLFLVPLAISSVFRLP